MPSPVDRSESLRLPPAKKGWQEPFWIIVGILMCGAMLVAASIHTAPPLVSDWQIHDAARPIANARVTDGKCSSRIMVNICDLTLNLQTASGIVSRRVNYVFTGVHVGDFSIQVMADPSRPEFVTSDLALDRLWNRTITLALIMTALLAVTVLPIVAMIRKRWSSSATS